MYASFFFFKEGGNVRTEPFILLFSLHTAKQAFLIFCVDSVQ